jgi:hypothetical protein
LQPAFKPDFEAPQCAGTVLKLFLLGFQPTDIVDAN